MKMLLSALMIATLCAATIRSAAQSPVPFDIVEATVDDVQTALRSGQVTCRSLVEHGYSQSECYVNLRVAAGRAREKC